MRELQAYSVQSFKALFEEHISLTELNWEGPESIQESLHNFFIPYLNSEPRKILWF